LRGAVGSDGAAGRDSVAATVHVFGEAATLLPMSDKAALTLVRPSKSSTSLGAWRTPPPAASLLPTESPISLSLDLRQSISHARALDGIVPVPKQRGVRAATATAAVPAHRQPRRALERFSAAAWHAEQARDAPAEARESASSTSAQAQPLRAAPVVPHLNLRAAIGVGAEHGTCPGPCDVAAQPMAVRLEGRRTSD
jgi:hypothetical protein